MSVRGGGLLMLGGPDSFADGQVRPHPGRRAAAGLPQPARARPRARRDAEYRLVLTREGWLQPWVRTRKTEDEERRGSAAMPAFQTLSRVGADQAGRRRSLAEVRDADGDARPRPGRPAVRQGARRGPADRRPLALGPAAARPGRGRPRPLLAADRPLARRRRARPGRGRRRGPRPRRRPRPSSCRSGSATPSTDRSTTPRSRSRSPLPGGDALTLDAEPDGREAGLYVGHLRPHAARRLPRRRRPRRPPTASTVGDARGRLGRPARRRRVRPARTRPRLPRDARREDRGRGRRRRPARLVRLRPLHAATPRSPSPGPRPCGTTRSTSSSPSPA